MIYSLCIRGRSFIFYISTEVKVTCCYSRYYKPRYLNNVGSLSLFEPRDAAKHSYASCGLYC